MAESGRQNFCSYLCCWSSNGAAREFDRLAAFMPSQSRTCAKADIPGGHFYLSLPPENPFHHWWLGAINGLVCFAQGEFFEAPNLADFFGKAIDQKKFSLSKLIDVLPGLNGTFSGFILDTKRGDAHSFTDRFGFSRIFTARRNETVLLSSSLWPLRECEEVRGGYSTQSIHDTLMFGFPLLGDTVYENIQTPRAGTVLSNKGRSRTETCYFDFHRNPIQRTRPQMFDEFREICKSHWASIEAADPNAKPAVALSGGKDSRVILGGLLESGQKPECIVGHSGSPSWDSDRGAKVGQVVDCPTQVINYAEGRDRELADSNVLMNGNRTGLWTLNLAREAKNRGCTTIYFGSSGDLLSGGWAANPRSFPSIDAMSDFTLGDYIEYDTTATEFANLFPQRSYADIRGRFRSGYLQQCPDLCDAELAFRIMTRNCRRIFAFMGGAQIHLPPLHFFHDNRVSDFYWTLPFEQMKAQRAHSALCGMHSNALGKVPATSFPFGVHIEPYLIPLMKLLIPDGIKGKLRNMVSGKKPKAKPKPVDAIELEKLVSMASQLEIDADQLMKFAVRESKPRLVEQRVLILNTQLDPTELFSNSSLIGDKRFERLALKV